MPDPVDLDKIVGATGAIVGIGMATTGKKKASALKIASYAALGIAASYALIGIVRKIKERAL